MSSEYGSAELGPVATQARVAAAARAPTSPTDIHTLALHNSNAVLNSMMSHNMLLNQRLDKRPNVDHIYAHLNLMQNLSGRFNSVYSNAPGIPFPPAQLPPAPKERIEDILGQMFQGTGPVSIPGSDNLRRQSNSSPSQESSPKRAPTLLELSSNTPLPKDLIDSKDIFQNYHETLGKPLHGLSSPVDRNPYFRCYSSESTVTGVQPLPQGIFSFANHSQAGASSRTSPAQQPSPGPRSTFLLNDHRPIKLVPSVPSEGHNSLFQSQPTNSLHGQASTLLEAPSSPPTRQSDSIKGISSILSSKPPATDNSLPYAATMQTMQLSPKLSTSQTPPSSSVEKVKLEPEEQNCTSVASNVSFAINNSPKSNDDTLAEFRRTPSEMVQANYDVQGSIQVKKQQELFNPPEESRSLNSAPVSPEADLNENSNDSSTFSDRNSFADERADAAANRYSAEENSRDMRLYCLQCDFVTEDKEIHMKHIQSTHNVCRDCKYQAESASQLEEHRQTCAPTSSSSSTKPKTKSKKLTCKVCQKEAANDEEFYEHRREHISPDKILNCEYCPFVTQYKHHLDYHMKNHTGNKPFKCQKCEYSCVNKSMLNSHMKSHSNFYSYRCKDCNYEAKYMHALKCHCRKYRHNALPVINPDGTINPFPIVDVYGTRRGPKVKRDAEGNIIMPAHYTAKISMQSTPKDNEGVSSGSRTSSQATVLSSALSYCHSPLPHNNSEPAPMPPFNPYCGIDTRIFHHNSPLFNTQSPPLVNQPSYLNSPQSPAITNHRRLLETLAKSQALSGTIKCQYCPQSLPSEELLQQHILLAHLLPRNSLVQEAGTPTRAPPRHELQSDASTTIFTRLLAARFAESGLHAMSPLVHLAPFQPQKDETVVPENFVTSQTLRSSSPTPLDLTKDHTPPQQIMRRRLSESPPDVAATSLTPPDTCSPPKKIRRSDHLAFANRRLENIEEEPQASDMVKNGEFDHRAKLSEYAIKSEPTEDLRLDVDASLQEKSTSDALECSICKITFRVVDMFKKHIAFHDDEEPLRCSFCKDLFADSSVFFEHCFNCKKRFTLAS
ncbi:hunchback [Hyalella azteca]|uniref:Hunchback n=1 Tax=Hyalella azteca TaxID=294128 RepID=A0A6A0H226_HYAAZ|nr:uncharacterized protein LOC108670387 [Hyalella azteca]XP_047737822.1 uncharacterized protein LOC108670387 [Hyalella azteca]XP_047737823.1 uncharacterized protein LOC108670387 [Hyalella azteca]KAA0196315.1 hunchback [Hyalella azteca]